MVLEGLTWSCVLPGVHPVLPAQHLQVHPAALGPDDGLLHRVRHRHTQDVPVGSLALLLVFIYKYLTLTHA